MASATQLGTAKLLPVVKRDRFRTPSVQFGEGGLGNVQCRCCDLSGVRLDLT